MNGRAVRAAVAEAKRRGRGSLPAPQEDFVRQAHGHGLDRDRTLDAMRGARPRELAEPPEVALRARIDEPHAEFGRLARREHERRRLDDDVEAGRPHYLGREARRRADVRDAAAHDVAADQLRDADRRQVNIDRRARVAGCGGGSAAQNQQAAGNGGSGRPHRYAAWSANELS